MSPPDANICCNHAEREIFLSEMVLGRLHIGDVGVKGHLRFGWTMSIGISFVEKCPK
jgi:hypothetical protein